MQWGARQAIGMENYSETLILVTTERNNLPTIIHGNRGRIQSRAHKGASHLSGRNEKRRRTSGTCPVQPYRKASMVDTGCHNEDQAAAVYSDGVISLHVASHSNVFFLKDGATGSRRSSFKVELWGRQRRSTA